MNIQKAIQLLKKLGFEQDEIDTLVSKLKAVWAVVSFIGAFVGDEVVAKYIYKGLKFVSKIGGENANDFMEENREEIIEDIEGSL